MAVLFVSARGNNAHARSLAANLDTEFNSAPPTSLVAGVQPMQGGWLPSWFGGTSDTNATAGIQAKMDGGVTVIQGAKDAIIRGFHASAKKHDEAIALVKAAARDIPMDLGAGMQDSGIKTLEETKAAAVALISQVSASAGMNSDSKGYNDAAYSVSEKYDVTIHEIQASKEMMAKHIDLAQAKASAALALMQESKETMQEATQMATAHQDSILALLSAAKTEVKSQVDAYPAPQTPPQHIV